MNVQQTLYVDTLCKLELAVKYRREMRRRESLKLTEWGFISEKNTTNSVKHRFVVARKG